LTGYLKEYPNVGSIYVFQLVVSALEELVGSEDVELNEYEVLVFHASLGI